MPSGPTKAQLAEELRKLKGVAAEFEAFKKNVVETATQYAEDNGWCETVEEALRDLDLGEFITSPRRLVTLTIEVEVEADTRSWDDDAYAEQAQSDLGLYHHSEYELIDYKVEEIDDKRKR